MSETENQTLPAPNEQQTGSIKRRFKRLSFFYKLPYRQRFIMLVFVLLFAGIGGYFIVSSFAAPGGGNGGGGSSSALTLLIPANGSSATTTPMLSWTSVRKTANYRVQVALNSDTAFASPVLTATPNNPSYTVSPPLGYGNTYRWRVRSETTSGVSAWSSIWTFTASGGGGGAPAGAVTNPLETDQLVLLGRGRMAESGTVSAMLYAGQFDHHPWAYFHDQSTGAITHVSLPVDPTYGTSHWEEANYALNGLGELIVWSGQGPIVARQYQLTGSPLPTSATLVSTTAFGDSDSRGGDFIHLASGGYVGVWNQQGSTGPQGLGLAYRSPSGVWSTTYPVQFMPTHSSKQTMAQNPVDGSIWIFNDPDAWGDIGAAHVSETGGRLVVNWTNASFIGANDGVYDADPENADIEALPDPSTGTVTLAYQSSVRQTFATSPTVITGSYPVVARIKPDGTKSFLQLPTYVERVSSLGLVVKPGETWLAYRPINIAKLTFGDIYISKYTNGSWGSPILFGTAPATELYENIGFGSTRAEFAANLSDGYLHRYGDAK